MLNIHVLTSYYHLIQLAIIDFEKQIILIANWKLKMHLFGNMDQNIVRWNVFSSDIEKV